MPLPLTVSCFSKIQIGFTFLVPAHPGSPGKRAIKRVCVCVCDRPRSAPILPDNVHALVCLIENTNDATDYSNCCALKLLLFLHLVILSPDYCSNTSRLKLSVCIVANQATTMAAPFLTHTVFLSFALLY